MNDTGCALESLAMRSFGAATGTRTTTQACSTSTTTGLTTTTTMSASADPTLQHLDDGLTATEGSILVESIPQETAKARQQAKPKTAAVPTSAVVESGVKVIGNAKLYLGDCLDVMPSIVDESIDMVFADLPYGTTECAWDSVIDLDLLWKEYRRIVKPNGAIVLTSAQPFTAALVMSNLEMYRCEWIWEKGAATGFLNSNIQPMRAHENVLVFYKKQPVFNPQMVHNQSRKTSKRKDVNSECYGKAIKLVEYDSTSRYPRDVLFFSSDKQLGNYHPTQKPVSLCEYFILTYSNEGDVILDNTMGSGTAGVACVNTNRIFIGIEKPCKNDGTRHFDTACQRIADAGKQQRMFA